MKVNVLGTGGAFDVREGNSSFVVYHEKLRILVDCGYDTYPALMCNGMANAIDMVCVTHCHDDHIGSLSAFIYYRFYVLKQITPIVTTYSTAVDLQGIFARMGMAVNREYSFLHVGQRPEFIKLIQTTNSHVQNMPSCAVNFADKLVISGDTGINLIERNPDVFNAVVKNGATLFHDAAAIDTPVHCHYSTFLGIPEHIRDRIYLYHHSALNRAKIQEHGLKTLTRGEITIE